MNVHDERNIPMDPQPESRSVLESFRFWIVTNLLRRNRQDARQSKAATDNAELRLAEARRALRQPGVSPELAEKFAKVVARIGGGK